MTQNFIFIGGIHGAGKGSICREICKQTNLVHLTASDVLKWSEISDIDNKKVKDIPSTQKRLIEGLRKLRNDKKNYLLDGHFCLFNSSGDIEKVGIETFKDIEPKLIAVVIADIGLIQTRLKKRDGKVYNTKTLDSMQTTELTHAIQIAAVLNVPFVKIVNKDIQEFTRALSLLPIQFSTETY